MAELATTVTQTLAEYYDELPEKVHHGVDPLATEQISIRPYRYGNSIGHLLCILQATSTTTSYHRSYRSHLCCGVDRTRLPRYK